MRNRNNTNVLVRNRDEQLVPLYYNTVADTLEEANITGAHHRTYMKFFASAEINAKHALSWLIQHKGWALTAQYTWSLEAFFKRYSGYKFLTEEDRRYINTVSPELVTVARATGTLTKTQVETLMNDCCQSKDKEATCLAARYLLALEELEKPAVTAQTNIQNQGTVILSHPDFQREQHEKMKTILEAKEAKRELAVQKQTAAATVLAEAAALSEVPWSP